MPAQVLFTVAQFARVFAWVMTVFLSGAALAIIAFDAGDYATNPDRQRAGLVVLELAILVVVIAAVLGPIAKRLAELRGRV